MQYRSWLFVPGDCEVKLGKAVSTGADVVIVDLDDGDPGENRAQARALTLDWLTVHRTQITENRRMARWVKISPLSSTRFREDLATAMRGGADGIVLPDAAGPPALQQLAADIYELEQANRIPTGSTRILPLVSGSPLAAMSIGSYLDAPQPRLTGLGWTGDSLAAALGASRQRDAKGFFTDAFRLVRAQLLIAARARGVFALDSFPGAAIDEKAIKLAAREARSDGFTGMFAVHAEQVPLINAAFTQGAEDDEMRANAPGESSTVNFASDQPLLLARRRQSFAAPDGQPRIPILRPA